MIQKRVSYTIPFQLIKEKTAVFLQDGKKETVGSAPQSEKIRGKNRIGADFHADTDIDRHQIACLAQKNTEQVDNNTEDIEFHQRDHPGCHHHKQQHDMHRAHDRYRYKIAVMDQKMQDLIDDAPFLHRPIVRPLG